MEPGTPSFGLPSSWRGEPQLPSIDRHTPNAGIVHFRDSEGHRRVLDIVTDPYGMRRREVVAQALRVEYREEAIEPVHLWVMNPIHCLQSRVHNVGGLRIRDAHGLRQLHVSIPCGRAFLRVLLDTDETDLAARRRRVMAWNNSIYRFVKSDHDAQTVFRELGVDPFDAVLHDDERLSERFREDGYPRWLDDLKTRRKRAARARELRAQRN